MRFVNPIRDAALLEWRTSGDRNGRATADNLWFEERVSPARSRHFEAIAPDTPTPDTLAAWQARYSATFVQTNDPDTFLDSLDPSRLVPGLLDTAQRIVRMEQVPATVMAEAGLTLDALSRAVAARDQAVLDVFLQRWNTRRDARPAFGAWKDELIDELGALDWPDRIRDRLGLAHYDPAPGRPVPVMLMEYDVASVLRSAAGKGIKTAFVIPTVLDSGPWPWFFPSPTTLPYGGRTVHLGAGPAPRLMVEFLHVGMTYTRHHIAKVGEIGRSLDAPDLRVLRNRHLAALRAAARRPDFGEDMA